jgi:general secretion pathway protein I
VNRASLRGFTLLEVLVAIAILGLGLTAILGAQVGLFSNAARAEKLTVASNLVRCQMEEVEHKLLQRGFPAFDEKEEGDCCDDEAEGVDGYHCITQIERVVLPDPSSVINEDAGTPGEDNMGPLGVLSKLQQNQLTPGSDGPASLQEISKSLGESASTEGMGPLVMGMAYPSLKPMLEASIRRLTVTVEWNEGVRTRDLKVTQFIAYPQMGGLDETDPGLDPGSVPGVPGAETNP